MSAVVGALRALGRRAIRLPYQAVACVVALIGGAISALIGGVGVALAMGLLVAAIFAACLPD